MWLDSLALGLLALFAVIGAWRGALASGLALAALVLSYGAAVLAGPRLAPWVAARFELGDVLSLAAASTSAFFATFLAMGVIGALMKHNALPPEGARDRFLGGIFGAVRGAGLV
ncbi:MAG: CvpA family protein, partial [Myxococcota bacterium]